MNHETEPKEAPESPESPAAHELSEAGRVAELEQRCAELEARWLRSQADYQNTRRRAQQELESAVLRALQPLLDELLLVGDYLDMALSSRASSEDAKGIMAGLQLTRAKLAQALETVDVRPIPSGGTFDPRLHEAGESRATREQPPGTILATVRAGYTWQGRILRPARVVVAAAPVDARDAGEA